MPVFTVKSPNVKALLSSKVCGSSNVCMHNWVGERKIIFSLMSFSKKVQLVNL